MKFDLSSLSGKTVTEAKLQLKITNSSSSTQNIKRMSDTSWSETSLTYNTRPSLGSVVTSFVGGAYNTTKEIIITTAVKEKQGQILSIAIDSTGSDGLDFGSRESTSSKPVLVIK